MWNANVEISRKVNKRTGKEFAYRPESSDLLMFKEGDYDRLDLQSGDRFMDIGANFGTNVIKYGHLVESMVCYEPIPDTVEMLRMNVDLSGLRNIEVFPVAVSSKKGQIEVWMNPKAKYRHSAASIIPGRGRDVSWVVQTVSFADELARVKPTVIKMDIEGAEFEVMDSITNADLKGVRSMAIEVHLNRYTRPDQWIEELKARLEDFECEQVDQPLLFGKRICTILYFIRKD